VISSLSCTPIPTALLSITTVDMQVDEPPMASSSRRKTVHITEPSYTEITRQEPFNYRSLPSHEPAICIDAGKSTSLLTRENP
jgi:hypothetical protein